MKRRIAGWRGDNRIKLLSPFAAFDAVMAHSPVSDPQLAPYRVDFSSLIEKPGAVKTARQAKQPSSRHKYRLTPKMIESYYLYNLLRGYVDTDEVQTVLEIGPGSANLAALLYHFFRPRMVLVDLPRTLCMTMPLVADLFPDASILMPHESGHYSSGGYDFVFLTPAQTDLIAEDSADLAINTDSFQEMTHRRSVSIRPRPKGL